MTLAEIKRRRSEILATAARHGARMVCIFGSVARGTESPDSDVDLLVRYESGRSLLDHAALKLELEALLGCRVEIASESGLKPKYKDRILAEAVPV